MKDAIIVLVVLLIAYGTSAWKYGYIHGLKDGKASIRDSAGTCGDNIFNSTADANTCLHAYNLAFKKGCDLIGSRMPGIPEFGNCTEYFNPSLNLTGLPF